MGRVCSTCARASGADIFRGRYRESFETARPIAPDTPLPYRFALPTANHVFLPGHRVMVQVASSWFPLYDRNPQTFVPNIFWAKPADYRKATQRIYHAPNQSSFVEIPVVEPRSMPQTGGDEKATTVKSTVTCLISPASGSAQRVRLMVRRLFRS
jgi:hypothetical protein